MRKKKKGDTSDPLDQTVHGEDGKDDFAREAADAAAFAQALANLEGDEEAEEPILDAEDQELDGDREAADDAELEGLDEKAPELVITVQDIREGILALEKVPSALTHVSHTLTRFYRSSSFRTRCGTTPTSASSSRRSPARLSSTAKCSCGP